MSEVPQLGHRVPGTQESTNWKLCMLCQSEDVTRGPLVLQPRTDSYKHLLEHIQERASLHDGNFVQVQRRLKDITKEMLCTERAVWHRVCYSNATSKTHIQRAMDRNDHALSTGSYMGRRPGQKRDSTEMDEPGPSTSGSPAPFTRSSTAPLDKDRCFFCQKGDDQHLLKVRTENAGKQLRTAVEMSGDASLKTRLNTSISPTDAHAIDVRYHKSCWTIHVFHPVRDATRTRRTHKEHPLQRVSLIELINLIDVQTQQQAYLSMDAIETTYLNILGADGLENHSPAFTRKWLKAKILTELPSVKSVLQTDRRKSAVLYSPDACEESMVHCATASDDDGVTQMKAIYKSAQVIRKLIADFKKEDKPSTAIPVSSNMDDVPAELYTLIRWIMVGTVQDLENDTRTSAVDRAALTVSQNIMFGFKSNRQVRYKPSSDTATFRPQQIRENPQVLGLGLTVHHDTRSKMLMDLLNGQGHCVSYGRTLLIETALANAVVENTRQFQGLYVPPFLKKGAFVFFAADNTDFAEDTADGKGTTHGTVTAVYQKADVPGEPIAPPLVIGDAQSLSVTPYHVDVLHCDKPKPQPIHRIEDFTINKVGVSESYQLTQLAWIVASALSRMKDGGQSSKIPGWAGYNSLLSTSQSVTQVGALPLLPEVAHEWSTLLTVIMQASQIRYLAVGDNHPTVISFDMALYEKVVQLLDARPDLKRTVVPRLGELHVVMAALRALGASMENSGIDDAWMEADVYGSATTRQILKCTHYKRALRAHIYSYVALYEMALEEFFTDNPQLKDACLEATDEVEAACSEGDKCTKAESVKEANTTLLQALTTAEVVKTFQDWETKRSKNAMFKSMMNYIHRVETILFFVAASRNADLTLHLEAGEALSKMFFAMDRIKYKRLWPRYIADMYDLRTNHPNTWKELEAGNISVTKNEIPFVSVGADHACEHLNKQMKVRAGLIGISNNANARQRFFMAAPELSCLSKEFKSQFNAEVGKATEHHDLGPSAVKREHDAIDKIKAAILSHGNPFAIEGDQLKNLITHAYIPDEYVPQILNIDATGQKLYEEYVSERINGDVSLWAPVKKQNNKMYMSGNKKASVKLRDKTVDLKETKDLYGRLMVLARSKRDIDLKQAIGNYEFTLTPRALFAPNGAMLPCNDKSKLIHLLEKLGTAEPPDDDQQQLQDASGLQRDAVDSETMDFTHTEGDPSRKIALVDGMVVLQKMTKKPATVVTVMDLSECFNARLMSLTRDCDEIILVFDTYKADSLKSTTREKRRQGKDPVQYLIRDDTSIKHIPMSRFLSHDKTKADLTEYLAARMLEYNKDSSKLVITSASGHTRSNSELFFEDNNHEEADTLLIHQAVLASRRNPPDAELVVFSPDTDVLVLVIANYDQLLRKTSISMASGVIQVQPIWTALGPERAKALPAFHAFSGADNTGRFSRIGKATWLQVYLKADGEVVTAFQMLSDATEVTDDLLSALATFISAAYSPKGIQIASIPELRWHLFCKHMAESDKLPPTPGALKQHILRVQIQATVWGQASVAQQQFLDPLKHGFYRDTTGQG